MTGAPLRISVVGHANTGKTSLLRTIARDPSFGEVDDRAGTTRGVSSRSLATDAGVMAEVFDTPGLEDPIELLAILDALRDRERLDGPAQLDRFLASPDASVRFAQESKALRALLDADAGLYVIDARDPPLAKHGDELEILARCGRPLVPVLNFTAGPHEGSAWRELLRRRGLHASVGFDTVVFDAEGEVRLFEALATLMPERRAALDALIAARRGERTRLVAGFARLIAELLLDAAAMTEHADDPEAAAVAAAEERLRTRARLRERICVDDCLRAARFRPEDCESLGLPFVDGRWGLDLFSPAALKRHGIRAGGGAAAGATAGLVIDLAVGGMSLGAAAALGAAIGALLGGVGGEGSRLAKRLRGAREVRLGDAALALLSARGIELCRALLRRGHAATAKVELGDAKAAAIETNRLVALVRDLVAPGETPLGAKRERALERLEGELELAIAPTRRDS